ncbi:MAG: endonuclease [Gammaproteobacteria bacterium]
MVRSLARVYDGRDWWPGRGPFEICLGAILVQNTSWENATRAIDALRQRRLLQPERLAAAAGTLLQDAVRPAGCYRQKAHRLQVFSRWWLDAGGMPGLGQVPTGTLRERLLVLHGIGPETADCILLYALGRPVFVVDAYTRRLLARLDLAEVPSGRRAYEALRRRIETLAGPDALFLGELHALIVEHGKTRCRATPRCDGCPLRRGCSFSASPPTGRRTSRR